MKSLFHCFFTLVFICSCNSSGLDEVHKDESASTNDDLPKEEVKTSNMIELTEHDETLWNAQEISYEALQDSIHLLIENSIVNSENYQEFDSLGKVKVSEETVYLKCTPQTTYGYYIETINLIKGCTFEFREQNAQKYYGKAFHLLNENQAEQIESMVKLNIKEKRMER